MHCFTISFQLYAIVFVFFNESIYIVNEDAGSVQPTLVLSNPLSIDITAEVFNIDGLATGKYCSI